MKKQLLLSLLLVVSLVATAQQYAVRVNGTTDYPAVKIGEADFQGREQYLAEKIPLRNGDVAKMCNLTTGDEWVISQLDPYGEYQSFTQTAAGYICKKDGCYDFYIKLKYEDDVLYIGPGKDCKEPTIVEKTFTVTGEAAIINGDKDWDPENAANDMTLDGTTYKLKIADLQLAEGSYEYKVIQNHAWTITFPAQDNAKISISKDGKYTIEYSYVIGDESPTAIVTNQETGKVDSTTTKKVYATAVPSQCGDVMLQAFYYDSYQDKDPALKNTRWATLISQASEINAYFDLVWLPPSAAASGTGYAPRQYSNQNSAWGSRAELNQLIKLLHAGNTKVIADIVVNHASNKSTWCDYMPYDFRPYAKEIIQPDASWITKDDEVWTSTDPGAKQCTPSASAGYDDGYGGEKNYGDARDWDHTQERVREMFRAYLKWLYNTIDYDGWRYDYCKGFHHSHVNDYNKASGAYFSVMEYWEGNPQELKSHIEQTSYNSLVFDFATKYTAFNDGIAAGNYGKLKGAGLPGLGMSKYAVTFVDSHDSYARDQNEMYGGNSLTGSANSGHLNGVLQANAYMLCMPGVPCVFYPHWVKLKNYIGPIILARHATGVHSESSVSDEAGDGYYKAYITGKKGTLYLALGPNSNSGTAPAGYTKAVVASNMGVYYKLNDSDNPAPQLIVSPGNTTFKDNTTGVTVTMQAIAISGTPDIYYTTDGQEPTAQSNKYTEPIKITSTTTIKAVAILNGVASEVQTYTYTYKEPQTTPITVKFYRPAIWTKVYLWAWTKAGVNIFDKWPGEEMVDPDGDNWYEYTFDQEIREINFIFNCGSNECQTSDLYTDEDVCYDWSGGGEELLPDCEVTALETTKAEEQVTIYPNPAIDVINIDSKKEISQVEVYSLTGQLMSKDNPNTEKVQMSTTSLAKGMYLIRVYLKDGTQTTTNFIKK